MKNHTPTNESGSTETDLSFSSIMENDKKKLPLSQDSQTHYYTRESIREGAVHSILPQLKLHKDIAKVKQDLMKQSAMIHVLVTDYTADLEKIKNTALNIKKSINAASPVQMEFYNSLVKEANSCFSLPVETDGKWLNYDVTYYNRKYICEFAELLGCIEDNITEIVLV